MRKGRLIDELELEREGQPAVGRSCAGFGEVPVAQVGGLIQGELEADGINGFDGGKQAGVPRRSTRDEIAYGHAPVADAPRHRRAQLGEFEIERRLALGSLLRGD